MLPGGFHAGEDNEYEGDFDVETSANQVFNAGDGSQVAGRDANAEDEAFTVNTNTNGSGVQVVGDAEGDIDNNHADDGSIAGNGNTIDNSTDIDASKSDDDDITITTSDDDFTVGDVNVQNDSAGAIQDADVEESATTGGEVGTIDDSLVGNEVDLKVVVDD